MFVTIIRDTFGPDLLAVPNQAAAPVVPTHKVVVLRVNPLGHEPLWAQKGNIAQVELPMRLPPLKGARRRGLVAQVFI